MICEYFAGATAAVRRAERDLQLDRQQRIVGAAVGAARLEVSCPIVNVIALFVIDIKCIFSFSEMAIVCRVQVPILRRRYSPLPRSTRSRSVTTNGYTRHVL